MSFDLQYSILSHQTDDQSPDSENDHYPETQWILFQTWQGQAEFLKIDQVGDDHNKR